MAFHEKAIALRTLDRDSLDGNPSSYLWVGASVPQSEETRLLEEGGRRCNL